MDETNWIDAGMVIDEVVNAADLLRIARESIACAADLSDREADRERIAAAAKAAVIVADSAEGELQTLLARMKGERA